MLFSKVFKNRRLASSVAIFMALGALTGCNGKSVPGLENVSAQVLQNRLLVSFLATQLQWTEGFGMPIPGLPDATLNILPSWGEGVSFNFSIPLASLIHNGTFYPESGLPDGRPLPDVESGQLPRWEFPVRDRDVSLYLSQDAFALFVPLDLRDKQGFPIPFLVSKSIEDERGNLIGKVYAIPLNASGGGSGLYVLLPYLGGSQLSLTPNP